MKNQDVRLKAAGAGLKLWEVAQEIGLADSSFSRKLRQELPLAEKERVFAAIDRLSQRDSEVHNDTANSPAD